MIKYLFCLGLCLNMCLVFGQQLPLIPYPKTVSRFKGAILVSKTASFGAKDTSFADALKYLNTQLQGRERAGNIRVINIKINRARGVAGAYVLNTKEKFITLSAAGKDGVFNGLVTLLQLCKTAKCINNNYILPRVIITDEPRYQWRGFMLDESRHFFGKVVVKDILNWMAFYKLNRFHWHLSDAQGWRLQIKKYPLLTTIGGIGNFTDSIAQAKYYSQADINEIVAYAALRNISIIPEFDMPGHASAANKAYPRYSGGATPGYKNFTFNPANEDTYAFIASILKEMRALFPSAMIHIGGDEVTLGINAWVTNAAVTKLMADKKMDGLQQVGYYFLRRIADTVQQLHSKTICWDEAVPAGLPVSNTIITWWRQNKPETLNTAISRGYQVILCPRLPMYFDFVQDSTHVSGRKWGKLYNSYTDVYHFPENGLTGDICSNNRVLGLQANLWTETVISVKRLQYLLFPRMAALAGAGWEFPASKNDTSFNIRLTSHLGFYTKAGICFYDPFLPSTSPEVIDIKPDGDIND